MIYRFKSCLMNNLRDWEDRSVSQLLKTYKCLLKSMTISHYGFENNHKRQIYNKI